MLAEESRDAHRVLGGVAAAADGNPWLTILYVLQRTPPLVEQCEPYAMTPSLQAKDVVVGRKQVRLAPGTNFMAAIKAGKREGLNLASPNRGAENESPRERRVLQS